MSYNNATRLTPQQITRSGIQQTTTAADVTNGNIIVDDGRTALRVVNTGGSPVTVTMNVTATAEGLVVPNRTITVAATTGDELIALSGLYHQAGSNDCYFNVSGACQLAAITLP